MRDAAPAQHGQRYFLDSPGDLDTTAHCVEEKSVRSLAGQTITFIGTAPDQAGGRGACTPPHRFERLIPARGENAKDKKAKRRTLQASSLAVLDGLLFVVHPNGLEPLTDRLEGGCSIQLS